MITVLLNVRAANLTEAQETAIRNRGISWTVLNVRAGRALLDMIGERADLVWLRNKLVEAGLDPKPIAAWDATTGRRLKAVVPDLVAWRQVAPNVVTYDEQGNATRSRPTTYTQACTWLGWAPHTEQDEDE